MNILPKKNWHVRKKENIARVRRDEAEAAEQERKREQRQALAQQEARTEHLRAIAKSRRDDKFVTSSETSLSGEVPGQSSQQLVVSEHINFFREAEEGQKDVRTNSEYEKEKRAEKEKAEKDIGLLTYLGQTSLDSKGTVPWYHKPSRPESSTSGQKRPITQEIDVRKKRSLDPMTQMSKYLDVKYQAEHEGHKRPREPPPSSSSKSSAPKKPSASKTIAELRAERLERERKERRKQDQLLRKLYGPPEKEKKEQSVQMDDRSRRYNSQFNPDLVKVKKKRYDYDEF